MGMMGGMGMGGQSGWFGNTAQSIDQVSMMLEMNSMLFDRICDQATCMWMCMRDMLMWLYGVKNALISGQYRERREIKFESDEERKEWEARILKRIYCVAGI